MQKQGAAWAAAPSPAKNPKTGIEEEPKVKDILDEIIKLHQHFKKLYSAGVIAVNRDNIHVTEDFIQNMPGKLRERYRKNRSNFPFLVYKHYKELEFFSLSKQPFKGGANDEQADID